MAGTIKASFTFDAKEARKEIEALKRQIEDLKNHATKHATGGFAELFKQEPIGERRMRGTFASLIRDMSSAQGGAQGLASSMSTVFEKISLGGGLAGAALVGVAVAIQRLVERGEELRKINSEIAKEAQASGRKVALSSEAEAYTSLIGKVHELSKAERRARDEAAKDEEHSFRRTVARRARQLFSHPFDSHETTEGRVQEDMGKAAKERRKEEAATARELELAGKSLAGSVEEQRQLLEGSQREVEAAKQYKQYLLDRRVIEANIKGPKQKEFLDLLDKEFGYRKRIADFEDASLQASLSSQQRMADIQGQSLDDREQAVRLAHEELEAAKQQEALARQRGQPEAIQRARTATTRAETAATAADLLGGGPRTGPEIIQRNIQSAAADSRLRILQAKQQEEGADPDRAAEIERLQKFKINRSIEDIKKQEDTSVIYGPAGVVFRAKQQEEKEKLGQLKQNISKQPDQAPALPANASTESTLKQVLIELQTKATPSKPAAPAGAAPAPAAAPVAGPPPTLPGGGYAPPVPAPEGWMPPAGAAPAASPARTPAPSGSPAPAETHEGAESANKFHDTGAEVIKNIPPELVGLSGAASIGAMVFAELAHPQSLGAAALNPDQQVEQFEKGIEAYEAKGDTEHANQLRNDPDYAKAKRMVQGEQQEKAYKGTPRYQQYQKGGPKFARDQDIISRSQGSAPAQSPAAAAPTAKPARDWSKGNDPVAFGGGAGAGPGALSIATGRPPVITNFRNAEIIGPMAESLPPGSDLNTNTGEIIPQSQPGLVGPAAIKAREADEAVAKAHQKQNIEAHRRDMLTNPSYAHQMDRPSTKSEREALFGPGGHAPSRAPGEWMANMPPPIQPPPPPIAAPSVPDTNVPAVAPQPVGTAGVGSNSDLAKIATNTDKLVQAWT